MSDEPISAGWERLGGLRQLTALVLNRIQCDELPRCIGQLTSLRMLVSQESLQGHLLLREVCFAGLSCTFHARRMRAAGCKRSSFTACTGIFWAGPSRRGCLLTGTCSTGGRYCPSPAWRSSTWASATA